MCQRPDAEFILAPDFSRWGVDRVDKRLTQGAYRGANNRYRASSRFLTSSNPEAT